MGKGDQKTRRGKLARGSHGKTRPNKKRIPIPVVQKKKKKSKPRKKTTGSR
jgi:30S ribosomal protein S31